MLGRQEAATPIGGAAVRQAPRIRQDNECGQRVRLITQPVREPTAQRWKAVRLEAAVLQKHCRRVVGRIRMHGSDDGQFVGDGCQMREKVGDPKTAFAALAKSPFVAAHETGTAEKGIGLNGVRHRFPMEPGEFRFVVEGIDVAEPANQADVDCPFDLRWKIRKRRLRLRRRC